MNNIHQNIEIVKGNKADNINKLIDLYNVYKQDSYFTLFKEEAIKDLVKSGLEPEIVKEAKIEPATKPELERRKINWFDKKSRQERFTPLFIIPYLTAEWDTDFCRVKVIPNPEFFDGKYTQQSSQHLKYPCHLYILPSELEKLKSNKCKLAIVEGEKKTLKLIQEIRKIEDELGYKVAVIGISGINNWQAAPEWEKLNLLGREVILFFDADSEHNKAVVEAELELAGFLYSKGAGAVRSAVWSVSEGKGIDDFLVNSIDVSEDLRDLLDNIVFVFEKYRNRLQDKESLKAFFKYPVRTDKMRLEYLIEVVKEETNVKKQLIKTVITSLQVEYEYELQQKQQEQIKQVFGLDFIQVPKPFIWDKGRLKTTKDDDLTDFFIVKDRVINQDKDVIGIVVRTIRGKEFFINIDELNKKHLHYVFTKNDTILAEPNNNLVLKYIALYQSYNSVNIRKLIERTGWNGEEFYLPQFNEGNDTFGYELLERLGFGKAGDKNKELELMKKLITQNSHLAIGYLLGFGSTLIKPLNADNFVAFLQGATGRGKTTATAIGLSLFGYYDNLLVNMNRTSVGSELLLDKRKDVLTVFDELNTSKSKDLAKEVVNLIYDFYSKKGRTRGRQNLTLQEWKEFRGILAMTSEDSLNSLMNKADKTVKGALRRTLVWDFTDYKELSKELTDEIYQTISNNYGNLIEDFISYVKNNVDEIKRIYHCWITELRKRYKLNGQERHLALLFTTADLISKVFDVNIDNLKTHLYQIADCNAEQFEEATVMTKDRIRRKIIEFIHSNIGNFEYVNIDEHTNIVIEKNIPRQKVLGKLEKDAYYFTSLGLQELATFIQIPEKELKKLFVNFGFAEKDKDRIIKRTMKSVAGMTVKTYEIKLDEREEETPPPPREISGLEQDLSEDEIINETHEVMSRINKMVGDKYTLGIEFEYESENGKINKITITDLKMLRAMGWNRKDAELTIDERKRLLALLLEKEKELMYSKQIDDGLDF